MSLQMNTTLNTLDKMDSSIHSSSFSPYSSQYLSYQKQQNCAEIKKKIQKQKKNKKNNLNGNESSYQEQEQDNMLEDQELCQKIQSYSQQEESLCTIPKSQTQFQKQCIIKDPIYQHKYLILPNILIDFDLIREGNFFQDQTGLRQFRSSAQVNYLKRLDMVEMEIGINGDAIRNFNFISDMLDSMGNEQAHALAQSLRQYDQILTQCEVTKKEYSDSQYSQSTCHNLNFKSSSEQIQQDKWNFQKSRDKAYQIIQHIIYQNPKGSKYMTFRLLRGSSDTSELFSQITSREYLSFLLGTSNLQQIIQIILRHGMLIKKSSVDTFGCIKYSGEHHIYDTYHSEADLMSNNYDLNIQNTTVNDCTYQAQISYQKIQLSNYKNRFNDYLLIISPQQYANNFLLSILMKRLEEQQNQKQPLFSQPNPSFMDISYEAQSEVFIEKFYQEKSQQKVYP